MQDTHSSLTANGALQLAVLSAKENRELQKALKIEYARLDYVCFVNELLFRMGNSNSTVALTMCDDLLFILNKILLDNVFRHVVSKDSHTFMFQLAHRTFSKDIYINPFYINQIIESSGIYLEDKTELENELVRRLQTYLDDIYCNHAEALNIPLLAVFEMMFLNLQHINIGYYKFELMHFVQPMLLYTERQIENYLYA